MVWLRSTLVAAAAVLGLAAAAQDGVEVIRVRVPFEEERTLLVNSTVEYILEFVPSAAQTLSPARIWAQASAGVTTSPVLLTARNSQGAQTWQLPYESPSGEHLLYELERTLCVPTDPQDEDDPCLGTGEAVVRGELTVHVSTACAVSVAVRVRADTLALWRLPPHTTVSLTATETAAAVASYEFAEGEDSVRLVFTAQDDICAILSVHHYQCPIPETSVEVTSGLRMTVLRAGATHLTRSAFPRGFVVVCTVLDSDEQCVGDSLGEDWLWKDTPTTATAQAAGMRAKHFTLTMQATLTRGQYAVGVAVTLAVVAVFYVGTLAVLLSRRLPSCRALLAPQAPLADIVSSTTAGVDSETGHDTMSPSRRRRRDSTATYDSGDASDTESEEEQAAQNINVAEVGNRTADVRNGIALAAVGGQRVGDESEARASGEAASGEAAGGEAAGGEAARPFGLPARLNVAALSRRRAATLRARSDRYLYTLYTVAIFYALPVVQFVVAFQIVLNVSGSLDLCYFNFLCAHPAGVLSDFNHVFSNAAYLLLGALFMLHVRTRRHYRKRHPKHEEYGIPAHYGLLSALGAGMMVVALLSASYHVCPNRLNFQFDTAFMYVLAVLSMVKIYQSRHPDINARAHATFALLALLIALVVWGVLGGGAPFWAAWSALHAAATLLLSLRIYYVGQFRLDKESLAETRRMLRGRPLYGARLAVVAAANLLNWSFIFYGLFTLPIFPSHLLFVLLSNTLLYMLSYLAMKLLHGERLRWYSWCILAGAAGTWAPALYFFTYGSSDWSATPALSRHQNHECKVVSFYDAHDLWHLLSAAALYLSFCAMLTWDDGLSAFKRTDIAAF